MRVLERNDDKPGAPRFVVQVTLPFHPGQQTNRFGVLLQCEAMAEWNAIELGMGVRLAFGSGALGNRTSPPDGGIVAALVQSSLRIVRQRNCGTSHFCFSAFYHAIVDSLFFTFVRLHGLEKGRELHKGAERITADSRGGH